MSAKRHKRTQYHLLLERRSRSTQPEEGVDITEPEYDGEAVEDDGSQGPKRPRAGGADGERVGVPREECGAPPVPHEGHFCVAILSASLKTRSLLRFNHHQESSLVSSSPLSDRLRM